MRSSLGWYLFILAPVALAAVLLWRFPSCRRIRIRPLVLYVLVMSGLIYAALRVVAYIAMAIVPPREVLVVLWFTIAWRLAWEIWNRSVGRNACLP